MIIITLPWCYNSAITLMHFLANFCISCVVNNHLFGFFSSFTWTLHVEGVFSPKMYFIFKAHPVNCEAG